MALTRLSFVTALQQLPGNVHADEPGGAGDQYSHFDCL
jgi:hypothetical protein